MGWRMPAETAAHERTWMAFPREGYTLGSTDADREECYRAWTETAHAILEFEPVSMVVDPSELARARRMLSAQIEIVEAPLDEYWMRDIGPTFVLDDERPGELGAVTWQFNGWGNPGWAEWQLSARIGAIVAAHLGATRIESALVNEGGGIHVDGRGTVLLTETVQLDPRRNPDATRETVEAELARTIGLTHAIWLPRGLTRDYDEFGTNGHVDIVATLSSPGTVLLHTQTDPAHPTTRCRASCGSCSATPRTRRGRRWRSSTCRHPRPCATTRASSTGATSTTSSSTTASSRAATASPRPTIAPDGSSRRPTPVAPSPPWMPARSSRAAVAFTASPSTNRAW
jgi:agmatine deiminase